MTSCRWECDICEQPRYSSQMLKCTVCIAANKHPRFIGYCCCDKHTKTVHPDVTIPPHKSAVGILYQKVNHEHE